MKTDQIVSIQINDIFTEKYGGIGMDNKIFFSKEELQLLYAACMSYGGRLSEVLKSLPNERAIDGLSDRAAESWKIAQKIAGYMAE